MSLVDTLGIGKTHITSVRANSMWKVFCGGRQFNDDDDDDDDDD